MKQLKYFTSQAETLHATQEELARKGIAPEHLHVFTKDNAHHDYDGLILQSFQNSEDRILSQKVICFSLLLLLGCVALYYQWMSFWGVAIAVFLVSCLSLVSEKNPSQLKRRALKKVYFLVVDVDEAGANVVSNVARNYPDLMAQ